MSARLLEDMKHASTQVDHAASPGEYQGRLVALALIARQFLRESALASAALPSPAIRVTLLDLVQERLQALRQMPANAGCVGHNGHTVTAAQMTAQMIEAREWLQGWRGDAR